MSIVLLPDAEKIVGDFLRDHPAVTALDARVASRLPTSFTKPWVKVTQLDARNITRASVEHLVNYFIQIECYAGGDANTGQAQASALARTVRAVMQTMPNETLDDGVVVSRVIFTTHARIPDDAFEPSRERFILDAEISIHG